MKELLFFQWLVCSYYMGPPKERCRGMNKNVLWVCIVSIFTFSDGTVVSFVFKYDCLYLM